MCFFTSAGCGFLPPPNLQKPLCQKRASLIEVVAHRNRVFVCVPFAVPPLTCCCAPEPHLPTPPPTLVADMPRLGQAPGKPRGRRKRGGRKGRDVSPPRWLWQRSLLLGPGVRPAPFFFVCELSRQEGEKTRHMRRVSTFVHAARPRKTVSPGSHGSQLVPVSMGVFALPALVCVEG